MMFIYYTQGWIKRANMKRKHGGEESSVLPVVKKKKLNQWQCFQKIFSKTGGTVLPPMPDLVNS